MNVYFDRILPKYTGGRVFIESFKKYSKHNVVDNPKDADVVYLFEFNHTILRRAMKYKIRKKKIIIYCISKLSYDQNKLTKKIAQKIADRIITITRKFSLELFGKEYNTIPNGIDLDIFKRNKKIKKQNLCIGVGRDDANKNQKYIWEKAAKDRKNRYKVVRNVSQKKLAEFYNKAKIVYLPSKFEVFPAVILEAIACKTRIEVSEGAIRFMDYDINYIKKHIKDFAVQKQIAMHDKVIDSLAKA